MAAESEPPMQVLLCHWHNVKKYATEIQQQSKQSQAGQGQAPAKKVEAVK